MSTLTDHLQLVKPDTTDNITPAGFNQNFDKIDEAIFDLQTDYIVAQGIQNGWTYRRWASGVMECWTRTNQTTKNFNNTGCTHYESEFGNFDSGFTFIEEPVILATFGVYATLESYIKYASASTTGVDVYGYNNGKVGAKCWFSIHLMGRWKE